MDPSFSQNPGVPFYTFRKSVGSAEPTEPTLTTPLLKEAGLLIYLSLFTVPVTQPKIIAKWRLLKEPKFAGICIVKKSYLRMSKFILTHFKGIKMISY